MQDAWCLAPGFLSFKTLMSCLEYQASGTRVWPPTPHMGWSNAIFAPKHGCFRFLNKTAHWLLVAGGHIKP